MVGIIRCIDERLPVSVADGLWIAVEVAFTDRGDGTPCWVLEFACPGIDKGVSRTEPDEGEQARTIGGTLNMCFGHVTNDPVHLCGKVVRPEISYLGLFRRASAANQCTQRFDFLIFIAVETAAQGRRWRGGKLITTEHDEGCDIREPGNCHGRAAGWRSG